MLTFEYGLGVFVLMVASTAVVFDDCMTSMLNAMHVHVEFSKPVGREQQVFSQTHGVVLAFFGMVISDRFLYDLLRSPG